MGNVESGSSRIDDSRKASLESSSLSRKSNSKLLPSLSRKSNSNFNSICALSSSQVQGEGKEKMTSSNSNNQNSIPSSSSNNRKKQMEKGNNKKSSSSMEHHTQQQHANHSNSTEAIIQSSTTSSGPTCYLFSPCSASSCNPTPMLSYINTSFIENNKSNMVQTQIFGLSLSSQQQQQQPTLLVDEETIKSLHETHMNTSPSNVSFAQSQNINHTISHYQWSHDASQILIPYKGCLYLYTLATQKTTCIYANHDAMDAQFSPNDQYISFISNANLYLLDSSYNIIQLTFTQPDSNVMYGMADFLAQEEMDRYKGYWWSADSTKIIFIKVDEAHIPIYRIIHHSNTSMFEDHRYPFAGKDNPKVSLGVFHLNTIHLSPPLQNTWESFITWLQPPSEAKEYIARVNILNDDAFVAQWQNRLQNILILKKYSLKDSTTSILLKETSDTWINLHYIFTSFYYQTQQYFLFASERSGYNHLYLYNQYQHCHTISSGNWIVESIVGVDISRQLVYITGTFDSCLERHLYALHLFATTELPMKLTHLPGMHTFIMDSTCTFLIDTHSDLHCPTSIQVYQLCHDKKPFLQHLLTLFDSNHNNPETNLTVPQLISFPTTDGTYTLHACLYLPDANRYGPGPYPLLCSVYGGPHVQRVSRSYSQTTADMRAQRLRSLGFALIKCDNRGSARRGKAFESIIYKQLGKYEVLDQVTAVRYLTLRGIANPKHVGIFGWSYGGYLASMCLFRAPDVFSAAVAGAPVTSWDGYDTHYTERYMGLPHENTLGYTQSSLFHHLSINQSKHQHILILHGLIDENVHFRHTARLVNYFIAQSKQYDLVIFPDERHSPKKVRDRVYMEQRICDFFVKHLLQFSSNSNRTHYQSHSSSNDRVMPGHL